MYASLPSQVLADAVSHLVVDKFSELTDNFTSPHARRKVLAGVVMTTGISLFFLIDELYIGISDTRAVYSHCAHLVVSRQPAHLFPTHLG